MKKRLSSFYGATVLCLAMAGFCYAALYMVFLQMVFMPIEVSYLQVDIPVFVSKGEKKSFSSEGYRLTPHTELVALQSSGTVIVSTVRQFLDNTVPTSQFLSYAGFEAQLETNKSAKPVVLAVSQNLPFEASVKMGEALRERNYRVILARGL